MKQENFFNNVTINPDAEVFETLFGDGSVKIERITSFGQSTPAGEWYDQENAEWVILLEGSAGLMFEHDNTVHMLKPGDYCYIAPHRRHRVEFTDRYQRTLWLAVHFPGKQ